MITISEILSKPQQEKTLVTLWPFFVRRIKLVAAAACDQIQRAMKPGRQRPKSNKVSVVVDNRHMNRTGRSTRANGAPKMSFPILRDQFSLPVEEQLQFLSWLFQGALSQCLHASSSADSESALGSISVEEVTSTPPPVQPFAGANVVDIQHPGSRKGLTFLPEEDRLLVKFRKEDALTWSEVTKRFSRKFPGRSKGSIQVYWSTALRKQLLSLR